MRNYEGVFIVSPDLTTEATKGVATQIQDLIVKNSGRIDSLQEWGKKKLAYKINKKQEGSFFLFNFQINPAQTKKLEQNLRLNDQIIRYLLINKDDQ